MRLTLRTLLAYLDDRLPPANARELGQKIVKSPFATELADRIKDVVRRRRLASTPSEQKSIDANLIAEYLDDQLTPELVALIEKEILGSDHNLAEVAAAHQILGLLSDPVEISDQLSQRLHKLDPFVHAESADTADLDEASGDAEWKPLAPQTTSARRSPMLLLLLMVLGWLVLLFTDSHLFDSGEDQTSVAASEPADADVQAAAENPDDANVTVGANSKVTGQTESATTPQDVSANTAPAAGNKANPLATAGTIQPDSTPATDTTPKASVPLVAANNNAPSTAAAVTETPTTELPAVAATENTVPMATTTETDIPNAVQNTTVPENIAAPAVAAEFEVRDDHGMHLIHDPVNEEWAWASDSVDDAAASWEARLSNSVSAVSDPFRVTVSERRAGWDATILGPSLFSAVSVSGEVPGIELLEGRLVLQRTNASDMNQFSMVASGRRIGITIPEGDDQVGIAVVKLPANGLNADANDGLSLFPFEAPAIVTVFAADNSVTLNVEGHEQPIEVGRGKTWQWNTAEAIPTVSPATPSPLVPEWVYKAAAVQPDAVQNLHEEAAGALRAEQTVASGANLLSKNKNDQLASYGVRLIALTRNVDQLTTLLLRQPNEEVVRREAIAGLRTVIQQSAAGQDRVRSVLETRLSKTELDNALKMLEGVSRVTAEDRFVSGWLVEMLSSNRAALREMAIENLEALTQERYAFFADDDAGRRSNAVKRWQRFLDRNDGRLVKPVE